jgi:glycosyltransferase involved in cell wall biosynthesis
MRFSVAIATFNEEENLSECLETIKSVANEIIIVDGSSTDKTVEIGKKYRAKVIVANNPPVFHLNKQKAIEACTGDWILQLDADERVTSELANEIHLAIGQSGNRVINGFWIPRKNFFLGKFLTKGGQYPDYTLRLYRRGKAYFPCKSVHEQVEVEGKTDYLINDLVHMADPNFGRYLKRWSRYVNLVADEIRLQNDNKPIVDRIHSFLRNMIFLPLWWFLLIFIRHKGFLDGWQGFIFAFFSGIKFPIAYIRIGRKLRLFKPEMKAKQDSSFSGRTEELS